MTDRHQDVSTAQRALWLFLLFTLAGPFLAAVCAALYTPLAIWANVAPFTAGDHGAFDLANMPDAAGVTQLMAGSAVRTFVWAPIAATVAAVIAVVLLFTRGEVSWPLAGAAGVIGFFVAYIVAPFDAGSLLPVFALAAGLVASVLGVMLRRIGILPPQT